MSSRQGYIYGVAGEDGPIKIGLSTNLHLRIQTLRFQYHKELAVVFYVPVDAEHLKGVEKLAHHVLRDKHVEGEWFYVGHDDALAAVHEAINRYANGERVLRAQDDPNKKPQHISLLLQKPMLRRITEWRARQRKIPSVSAAIRQLLEAGLAAEEDRVRGLTREMNSGDIHHSGGLRVASREPIEGSRPRQ